MACTPITQSLPEAPSHAVPSFWLCHVVHHNSLSSEYGGVNFRVRVDVVTVEVVPVRVLPEMTGCYAIGVEHWH